MKRARLLRKSELRSKSRPRPWRRAESDKVTDAVAHYVLARDNGCIAPTAGLGKRGPSTADNLVSLCTFHHRVKTENARAWRPLLHGYLNRVERGAA